MTAHLDNTARHSLQPLPPLAPIESGHTRFATAGGVEAVTCRLPAVSQVLLERTAKAHSIGGVRRRGLLFAVTVCLFGIIVPVEIAYASEMWVSRTIAGIPIHFALTALVLLVAFANDSTYLLKMASRPAVLFYGACLLMVVVVGFVRNGGNRYVIFADIYNIRWFFVGFMLMRLAIVSGSLRRYLMAAAIIVLATALRIDSKNSMGGQIDTTMMRATSVDLWPVMNLGTIMLGLLITVNWPQGVFNVAFCSSAFALLIFLGGIKTSTRSLFLAESLCFLLCLIALSRDPRMQGKGQGLRRAGVGFLVLAAGMLAYLVATGKVLGNVTQLGTRFSAETSQRYDTGGYRIAEAFEMLEVMPTEAWFFGMGAGGMWYSNRIQSWMGVPHIAVLGWLQKGGLFIFLVALLTLYIRPSFAFFKAVTWPRRDSPLPTPILIVGPPLLAWAGLTFLSGGLDIGSFLGLGGLAALWVQLADDERRFRVARTSLATAPR